jgi:two-component system LytT family response regulator
MIKAIIIDDEPLARSIVQEYLRSHPSIIVVQECNDGFEGVKAIQQHQPQLIFLDIQMPKINGFEMLELIEQPPAVIFTTAFDEYAIKAFESHATDYLLKPFSQERFDKAIQKWKEQNNYTDTPLSDKTSERSNPRFVLQGPLLETASQSPQQSQRVVVKTGGRIKIIPVDDIDFLEAADDYVKIHTAEGAYLKNKTMSHFEKILDMEQFVRTHRSYIVNLQRITRLDAHEKESWLALLTTGARIPVSKTGYTKLKDVLGI